MTHCGNALRWIHACNMLNRREEERILCISLSVADVGRWILSHDFKMYRNAVYVGRESVCLVLVSIIKFVAVFEMFR